MGMFEIPKEGLPPVDPSAAADWKQEDMILIIGAGASGIAAAYTLKYLKVPFLLLEASQRHGGRVQRNEGFLGNGTALDIGAEWLHTERDASVLKELLLIKEDHTDVERFIEEEIIEYEPTKFSYYNRGSLRRCDVFKYFYGKEHKFKNKTWSQYLEKYMFRYVKDHIQYEAVVTEIDYSSSSEEKIKVTLRNGKEYMAAKVICTVPISILKDGDITFTPELPESKQKALNKTRMKPGLKVAIEFKEPFYSKDTDVFYDQSFFSTMYTLFSDFLSERTYFDSLMNKGISDRHVLGVLCYGKWAEDLCQLDNDDEIFKAILKNLDNMFDGQASANYIQHMVTNWTKEPFIRGAYSNVWYTQSLAKEFADQPLADNRIFFAGEFVGGKYGPTVHGCCITGRRAALKAIGTEYKI